jgi:tetratricopeptide (TPR) repeat protein
MARDQRLTRSRLRLGAAWSRSASPGIAASLTLALALPSPALAAPGAGALEFVAPSEADMSLARIEYEKGEKAYRLGQFQDAAVAFEKAYEKSGLPDILYNIGLSHRRWYDVDPDVAHLRKARVVFQNYIIEIQKNPELGDLAEAEAMIQQIDEKIAAHEEANRPVTTPDEPKGEPIDLGPDPGKKLRLGGAIAMGVGGAFIVGGTVGAVVLGVRGQGFEDSLRAAYAEREELGCMANSVSQQCRDNAHDIEVFRRNGRSANALAVGLGASLGGLGLIGIVSGAVLFIQGNKKTKRWEARQFSVVPQWSPEGGGLQFTGRF